MWARNASPRYNAAMAIEPEKWERWKAVAAKGEFDHVVVREVFEALPEILDEIDGLHDLVHVLSGDRDALDAKLAAVTAERDALLAEKQSPESKGPAVPDPGAPPPPAP